MHLTHADIRSDVWRRFCKEAAARLAQLREKNDILHLDEVKTAEIRGRIACLKEWLALKPEDGESASAWMSGLEEPGSAPRGGLDPL